MERLLEAQPREKIGTRHSAHLRKDGFVPGVVYGRGMETISLTVDEKKLKEILRHQEKLVKVKVGNDEPLNALVQEVQLDAITGRVLHFDAHMVRLDEKIEIEVTVVPIGVDLSPGVIAGGSLEIHVHEVTVSCFPDRIPDKLEVDVSAMQIGDYRTVADIIPVEGIEIVNEADEEILLIEKPVDVAAETNIEQTLQALEGAEPTVLKQKEPGAEGEEADQEPKKDDKKKDDKKKDGKKEDKK